LNEDGDRSPATLTQFTVDTQAPGYWRVMFSNPPIFWNLLNSTTVVELGAIVGRVEQTEDLRVVVFACDHPDFFMARYDLFDTSPVELAPTESGVTSFIDSMVRMNEASPVTIVRIRGRAPSGGSEFALSCDLRLWLVEIRNADGKLVARGQVRLFNQPAGQEQAQPTACSQGAPRQPASVARG